MADSKNWGSKDRVKKPGAMGPPNGHRGHCFTSSRNTLRRTPEASYSKAAMATDFFMKNYATIVEI
jgi:hypothetical protein